ncbi:cytochrome P450 [Streptomyces olivaceiscleroticus]|uniref:Cytochrome P450 n=1 Tax=Streptomyces olivaceiscleroticus TaxID=68245 RepID=A0ABN1AIE1_9ACTN
MNVDLTDSELFASNKFWDALAHLRRTEPVYWHPDADGGGFWALTRYDDIVEVYSSQDSFSNRYGMRLDSNADAVAAVSQRMLSVSDPPNHTQLKRVLMQEFTPAKMRRLDDLMRKVVHEVVQDAVAVGEIDLVDVVKKIPNYVSCVMMGIPRADWEWIGQITTDAFEGADEETRAAAHGEIFLFFTELLADRRARPGDDFVSSIANARKATDIPGSDRSLSDEEIIFNCNGVIAGANETTRYSAAGAVLALAENPDEWAKLRRATQPGVETAAEEVLRWTSPGVHALRTVVRSTEVGGVRFNVGDRVTLWNVSANRDEDVFDDPHQFRVDRSPNRHIAFGAGRHLCLGARLARLELTVFLEALVQAARGFELTAEPVYNGSNFTWGLRSLPIRLLPA